MRPKAGEFFVRQFRRPAVKYLFALAMVVLSLLLRSALTPLIGSGYQYVTVFPLIIVVAILIGRGPAILHAVLAGTLATYYYSVELGVHSVLVTLIVVFSGFLAGDLAQNLHNAVAQAHQRSEELAESEQKFRLLADNAQAVIGIVQGDRFVYINPYFEKLSGYTVDEVLNIEIWRLIHPQDRLTVLERAERRQAGRKVPGQYEFRMLTKTGQTRWLDFSPVLITYRGKPAIVGIAFDITARKQAQDELTRTHGLIQGITQGTNDMIAAIDHEFRFVFFNDAYQWEYKKLWNSDIELQTSLLEPLSAWPRQQKQFRELWARALKGETFSVTAEFGPDPENKYIYDIRYNPVYDTDGKRIGAAHIMRNITEQVRIQKQLADSELFYRQTLESIPGMVFTTRPDGYCDYQSSQWVEYTGVPMEQMLGDGWNKLLHPDDRPRAYAAWRAAVEGRAPYDLEYRVRRFNGQYEWFKVRGRPIRDTDGNIVRWFGVATNISDLKQTQEALAESEALFRGTFENAAVGITLVDLDGNWIDANRHFCKMTGYSKEALVGSSFTIVTHPDDIEDDRRRFGEMKQGRMDSYFVEKRYVHHDGHMLWVDLYRAVQRDENNKPLYTIAVVIDITERKRAEEALRESEKRFRELSDSMPQIVWAARPDGYLDYFNKKWYELTDADPNAGGDESWLPVLHPDDRRPCLELWHESLRTGSPYYFEFRLKFPKADQYRWHIVRALPVRDGQGNIVRWFGTATDIHELKQAQELLSESEQRYRTLFESIDEGFCVIEVLFDAHQNPVDCRFLEVNPAFERQTGLKDATGKSMRSLVPAHEAHWFETYGKVALTGRPVRFVNEASQLSRWYDVFAFRIGAPSEHKVAILFSDITKFKKVEADLMLYKDQLENKNKEMESIIGIVSHDLRAPLVNIRGFSHEIKTDCKVLDSVLSHVPVEKDIEKQVDKLLHHNIPESLSYIETSSEAMNNLVVTLIEVARAGLVSTNPERINMNELVSRILDSIKIKFKEANVSFDVEPLPDCFADRTQAAQIFTNLLDNAVKYLDPARPGQICIEGTTQGDSVLYWVSDNGIGIAPEEQQKIFEPYYQLKEKAAGGVGMGLATVKKLLDRNNGKIWVISEKDQYSVFYVALPASPAQTHEI